MATGIGILVAERIAAGVITEHRLVGHVSAFPDEAGIPDVLQGMPAEVIAQQIVEQVKALNLKVEPEYIGLGFPGILRDGVIEDSPNLLQLKGLNIQLMMQNAFEGAWPRPADGPARKPRIGVFNDADIMAAGIAATRGHLDRLIRVWTLGNGIGYGRYPFHEGVWEAGHSTVSLDPKEHFCGCGGKGHLEGVMGQRAMRLRFMDLEPDEIFEQAAAGESRCVDFVKLWHRALAAATATSIHLDGPGKFFITGFNARFLNLALLGEYMHEMVKLSPLQGYSFEVVTGGEEVALIGAAVNAARTPGHF